MTETNMIDRLKLVATAPTRVVGILEHKDRIFVACEGGVYELLDGILHPVPFVAGPAFVTKRQP